MNGKDYYRILGVTERTSGEEIKRAYRKLALECHPDRNPEDKVAAEERFKEISEAYGVLIDGEKRRQYDQSRRSGLNDRFSQGHFRFTQEDVFRDVFRDPNAGDVFGDLKKEFERFGLRFDERFFKEVFFGKRGFFFGGMLFRGHMHSGKTFKPYRHFGNLFDTRNGKVVVRRRKSEGSKGLLGKLGRKVGNYLLNRTEEERDSNEYNLYHSLSISHEEAVSGTKVTIAYKRGGKEEKLAVKIPAGIVSGTRLRIKGKGLKGMGGESPGDLFLDIKVKSNKI